MKPTAMVQEIEHWPPEKLVPFDRNPRTHSPNQVAQIAMSRFSSIRLTR